MFWLTLAQFWELIIILFSTHNGDHHFLHTWSILIVFHCMWSLLDSGLKGWASPSWYGRANREAGLKKWIYITENWGMDHVVRMHQLFIISFSSLKRGTANPIAWLDFGKTFSHVTAHYNRMSGHIWISNGGPFSPLGSLNNSIFIWVPCHLH